MTKINNTVPPSKLLSLTVSSPVPCCYGFLLVGFGYFNQAINLAVMNNRY
nr:MULTISPECIES: hypothetical protein [unclassified Providencia]